MAFEDLIFAFENYQGCLSHSCTFGSEYIEWLPEVILLISTIIFLLAASFMVSRALGRKDIEAVIRHELRQTFIAVIWIIIIASMAVTTCTLSCGINGESSPFETANNYLSRANVNIQVTINSLYNSARDLRIKTAKNLGLFGVSIDLFAGCSVIARDYETLANFLSPFVGSLIVQQLVLSLISGYAFTVLLPIGIILRLVPFVRESGTALIAIAIALYVIFPLTYVVAERATVGFTHPGEILTPPVNCIELNAIQTTLNSIGSTLPIVVFFPGLSMIITLAAARALMKVLNYDFRDVF